MAVNWEEIGDFEVATAEFAQSKFMNQVVVKVDADTDLPSLSTDVKTAYVLATGITYARDSANNWKPLGGVAAIGSVAPSNPQTGQIWVDTTDKLPAPVRGVFNSTASNITATSQTQVPSSTTFGITVARSVMCAVTFGAWITTPGATGLRMMLSYSGAITGNSGPISGALVVESTGEFRSVYRTFHMILPTGTTTFALSALRTNTSNTPQVANSLFEVCPINWGDLYAAGSS